MSVCWRFAHSRDSELPTLLPKQLANFKLGGGKVGVKRCQVQEECAILAPEVSSGLSTSPRGFQTVGLMSVKLI